LPGDEIQEMNKEKRQRRAETCQEIIEERKERRAIVTEEKQQHTSDEYLQRGSQLPEDEVQ
jgi:hypothetical protein